VEVADHWEEGGDNLLGNRGKGEPVLSYARKAVWKNLFLCGGKGDGGGELKCSEFTSATGRGGKNSPTYFYQEKEPQEKEKGEQAIPIKCLEDEGKRHQR